ncbi:unnamed protein product [Cyprideis torosa]|uniref:Uncharacterized protein n=1 Tax=Cyprideis torosa TaxID=163714 RepID=A0A7R8WG08_9CRUS|nr:unnamed protein product [Cyprideis torosa]CAG0897514.1 unnamed protein product [Cyprideis torosa]
MTPCSRGRLRGSPEGLGRSVSGSPFSCNSLWMKPGGREMGGCQSHSEGVTSLNDKWPLCGWEKKGYTSYSSRSDEVGIRCPADKSIISAFAFNATAGKADATIYSMFKFPKSNKAHFQCDIVLCKVVVSRVEILSMFALYEQEEVRTYVISRMRICINTNAKESSRVN